MSSFEDCWEIMIKWRNREREKHKHTHTHTHVCCWVLRMELLFWLCCYNFHTLSERNHSFGICNRALVSNCKSHSFFCTTWEAKIATGWLILKKKKTEEEAIVVVYRVRNSCSKTMCDLTIIPENYQAMICPLHEVHQHAACCVHHQALELVLLCGSCASGCKDCDVEIRITHFVVLETFSMKNLWERDWRKTNKLYILAFSSASLVLLLGHQIQRLVQLLHSLTLGAWRHEIKRDVAAAAGALRIALVQHDVHQTTSASTRHQSTEACCCRPRLSGRFHAFFSLGSRGPETTAKHTQKQSPIWKPNFFFLERIPIYSCLKCNIAEKPKSKLKLKPFPNPELDCITDTKNLQILSASLSLCLSLCGCTFHYIAEKNLPCGLCFIVHDRRLICCSI